MDEIELFIKSIRYELYEAGFLIKDKSVRGTEICPSRHRKFELHTLNLCERNQIRGGEKQKICVLA